MVFCRSRRRRRARISYRACSSRCRARAWRRARAGARALSHRGCRAAHARRSAHGIVKVGLPHLIFEIDGLDFAGDFGHANWLEGKRNFSTVAPPKRSHGSCSAWFLRRLQVEPDILSRPGFRVFFVPMPRTPTSDAARDDAPLAMLIGRSLKIRCARAALLGSAWGVSSAASV